MRPFPFFLFLEYCTCPRCPRQRRGFAFEIAYLARFTIRPAQHVHASLPRYLPRRTLAALLVCLLFLFYRGLRVMPHDTTYSPGDSAGVPPGSEECIPFITGQKPSTISRAGYANLHALPAMGDVNTSIPPSLFPFASGPAQQAKKEPREKKQKTAGRADNHRGRRIYRRTQILVDTNRLHLYVD